MVYNISRKMSNSQKNHTKKRRSTKTKRKSQKKTRVSKPHVAQTPSQRFGPRKLDQGRTTSDVAGVVNRNLSLTQLRFIARSRGLPFGGLNKSQLYHKLKKYY